MSVTALNRALLLASYRGSPRLDDALELLRVNSYEELRERKSKYIRGTLTWASVASVAVDVVAKGLLHGDLEKAMDAAEDAHTLAERLRERDRDVHARVTKQIRLRIGMVEALAHCLEAAAAVRDGEASFELLGKLAALRMRWYALRRELDSDASTEWVLTLVQAAVGRVLTSNAGAGSKALASRALAAWMPVEVPGEASGSASPTASPASPTASPSPSESPPPPKRIKLGDGEGKSLTWDDDDLF